MAADLVTMDDLKAWLGMRGTDDDALIQELASAASDDFKRACSQELAAADYTEAIDGMGRAEVYLSEGPIISVTSVTDGGVDLDPSDYVVYAHPPRIRLKTGRFSKLPQGVTVVYRAGYETIPADIRAACCALGVFLFNRRRSLGKATEVVAGMSLTVDNNLPEAVAQAARRHAKTWGLFG